VSLAAHRARTFFGRSRSRVPQVSSRGRPLAKPALGFPRVVSAAQQRDPVHGRVPAIGVGHDVVEFEARGGRAALAARAHVGTLTVRARPDRPAYGRGEAPRGRPDGFRWSGRLAQSSAGGLAVSRGNSFRNEFIGVGSGAGLLLPVGDGSARGRAVRATASRRLRGPRRHPTRFIAAFRGTSSVLPRLRARRGPPFPGRPSMLFLAPCVRPISVAPTARAAAPAPGRRSPRDRHRGPRGAGVPARGGGARVSVRTPLAAAVVELLEGRGGRARARRPGLRLG